MGRIFIACETSKLGTEGIWEIKFETKQVHGNISMPISFKIEEWNVNIRWSLHGHPIDDEHCDDRYVLSGGLMLEGCLHIGWKKSVNPLHYGRLCMGLVWLSFDQALQVFDHIQPWVSRSSWKFRQVVMFALGLDPWQFAITGKIPQHHDGSVYIGMSSLDTGRMEMLKGTFLTPLGFALKGLPGEDTSHCPFGDLKYSTNGFFYTRHRSPCYTPSFSIGRSYCGCLQEILPFKRHGRVGMPDMG